MSFTEAAQTDDTTPAASNEAADAGAVSVPADNAGDAAEQKADAGSEEALAWDDALKGEDGQPDLAKIHEKLNELSAAPEGVPESAEGYSLDLAEAVEIAEGQAIEFAADDPIVADFLKEAHEAGKPQAQVQKELTFAAKALQANFAARDKATKEQVQSEISSLGDKGPARIKATFESLATLTGDREAANHLIENIATARAFEALEAIVSKTNGGAGGRTPAGDGQTGGKKPLADRLFSKTS